MFFIAGITGRVGGEAARRLLEQGRSVRALVRDPAKAADWSDRGVDVREGDLTDAEALTAALEDVDGAFVMQPTPALVEPGFALARSITSGICEALGRTQPPRLVVLSSVGSEQPSGLGNITQTHLLEKALASLTFPIAIVRAGAFIENNLGALDRVAATGRFDSFLQPIDRTFPMVATADIGKEVAALLTNGWTGRWVIELGSRLSPADLARGMAEALGRPVEAHAIPRERWPDTLGAMGFPEGKTGLWEEMQDSFNTGWIDFGVPGTVAIVGETTPAQVFAHARAYSSAD